MKEAKMNTSYVKFSSSAPKQDYKTVDFSDLEFCKKNAEWLLPQTLAMIARETKIVKTEQGTLDGLATMKLNSNLCGIKTTAIYRWLTLGPRSKIIGKVNEFLEYSALVPLYLYAFKKYNGIAYSMWEPESLKHCIDTGLYEAITSTPTEEAVGEDFSNLREYRGDFCYNKLPPEKAWKINITGNKEFDKLPRLTKVMLCQTWVAHPSIRNEYMILDPYDWDVMPCPLISTNLEIGPWENLDDTPDWKK